MTLRTIAAAVAALALAAAPAGAAPAQVTDPAGDWQIASQDVVRVRLERATVDGRRGIRAVLTLAAPPDATTSYLVRFGTPCNEWILGNHSMPRHEPFLAHSSCHSGLVVETTFTPAKAEVSGNDVVLTSPLANGLFPGRQIDYVSGQTGTGSTASVITPGTWYTNGDFAYGQIRYRV